MMWNLKSAGTAIAAAREFGAKNGLKPLAVVALDAGGYVIATEREDDASNGRVDIASGKALAATVMLNDIAHISGGETVFIPAAAGGVGSYAVQIAKLLGAGKVIAGAGTPEKRDIALALGADEAVEYRASGWTDGVLELTGGRGVDVALEMNGPSHLGETLGILAPFGTLISYGAVTGSVEGLDTAKLVPLLYDPAPSQILTGFNLGIWFEHRIEVAIASLQKLVGWIATGELRTPAVHLLPLADAAEAHRLLESGVTTGKVVLKP
jgi:NADPH:quinone reductase